MNRIKTLTAILFLLGFNTGIAQESASAMNTDAGDMSSIKTIAVTRGLTESGRNCITCHRDLNPGIVNDWKQSRHGHVGVSCIDCHAVPADSPMAIQHEDIFDTDAYDTSLLDRDVHISVLVRRAPARAAMRPSTSSSPRVVTSARTTRSFPRTACTHRSKFTRGAIFRS
jgi:hypothetical protein